MDADRTGGVVRTRRPSGNGDRTGIGLTLSVWTIHRHGRDVRVDFRTGEGSTFPFRRPSTDTNHA